MQARGLIIGAIATVLLSGCDASKPETPDPKPKAVQIEQKEALFEKVVALTKQTCNCAMAGRDTSKLDQQLRQLTKPLVKTGMATSSVPLRADMTCYPELGDPACTGRIVFQKSPETNFVCTGTQAEELDDAWNAAAPGDSMSAGFTETLEKRNAALLMRLRAMRAEAAAKIPQSACN